VSGPKSFEISKHVVFEAYRRVKANKGAAGVDGESIEQFEVDLKGNLYKLWNRLSSGSYFPPPVRVVEIPKPGGRGVRILGVPTVADRIAQTVAAMCLEPEVEKVFHPDSYGYRPGRSALDAVGRCRERCWRTDWVIDLDIQGFFDNLDHDLVLKAVAHHTDQGGSGCMCSGGLPRRNSGRTALWSPGIGAAHRARRSRPCWRTCSCTTRSTPG
jgi:RNA-directed DNA polymerase